MTNKIIYVYMPAIFVLVEPQKASAIMPKLVFRYGTMNSAKTANLLMMAYNYESKRSHVCVVKPQIDDRFGSNFVTSRVGLQRQADVVLTDDMCVESAIQRFQDENGMGHLAAVLVDECQFLRASHVEALRRVALHVNVFCFGLRTDYRSFLFEGSRRLMELADTIEEVKTTCTSCMHKAVITAKFELNNAGQQRFLVDGSAQVDLGAEEKYTSLCFKCWHEKTSARVAVRLVEAGDLGDLGVQEMSGGAASRDTLDTCCDS